MDSEPRCLTCAAILDKTRTKFCCQQHAMKWHNSRAPWKERKDRHHKNALKRAAYKAAPEFWKNKQRKWREDHPEQQKFIDQRMKEKYWSSPWRKIIAGARTRAARKHIPFDLTFEWGEARWTGFCELTKMPFVQRHNATIGIFSPSLDRIDPTKGYTQKNCRFILLGVNGLKHDGTDEAMYLVAEALIKSHDQNLAPATPKHQKPDLDFAEMRS